MKRFFESPPKLTLSITNTCNLECAHCYGDCTKSPSPGELGTAEVLAFIDYLVDNNFIQIYIEGGEPLLRPDFNRILKYCGRKLMTLVRTHGTLLTARIAREWKTFGVGRVYVDIMGATAETHESLTGVRGSFRKSCAAVSHLRDAGIETDAVIIMNRRNFGELQAYLELAAELGAARVGILRLYPLGRAKRRWHELALSLEEQEAAIARLEPPEGLTIMQSWHPRDRNCCWQAAAVNPFGDSIGCMYLREYVNYGNIRTVPFLDTWHGSTLYKKLRSGDVDKSCGGCHATSGTRGGCRSTAYAFHRRWDAPDPFCSTLNNGVDLRVLPDWLLQPDPKPPGTPDSGDGGVFRLHAGDSETLHSQRGRMARPRAVRRKKRQGT
ncbi:MAG TPA: radical SAM protein [Burkholderiales bacterium]|nr:radical SAM protein [Burkholderiales bacterium]